MDKRSRSIILWLAIAVAVVVAFPLLGMLLVVHLQKPSVYRFPFAATKQLTDEEALELTKEALVLDGKGSEGMHPVPWAGQTDAAGRQVVFARREGYADEGTILWWISRSDCVWEYSVHVTRKGDEVVCAISRLL